MQLGSEDVDGSSTQSSAFIMKRRKKDAFSWLVVQEYEVLLVALSSLQKEYLDIVFYAH
jgi:hypothetical protein